MIMEGSRVTVFDPILYQNDVDTPLSVTVRPATVVCRYGMINSVYNQPYDDLIDVVFDHRPDRISKGHFTSLVKEIKT